jgi:methionyl-tRNA formyltransferase
LKIIFLGTPDFAVATLDAMVQHQLNVVAVVTAPDKPAGRGMKLQQSAVKKYAVEYQIPVLQPEKLRNEEFLQALKSYQADLQVVVAFRMLPEVVWNMPPLGTINVHASLLPNYRGAAPINWAIINGEAASGVTTFKLKHEIDTGDILLQEKVIITETDNAGILHDKLMTTGAQLLVKTIDELRNNTLKIIPQTSLTSGIEQEISLKHAPKIFTETCKIDWSKSTIEVYNLIRGLSPYPAAFTTVNDKKMKLFEVEKMIASHSFEPGYIETDHKKYIRFYCTDGYISIKKLQLEGKTQMLVEDFLRGNKI